MAGHQSADQKAQDAAAKKAAEPQLAGEKAAAEQLQVIGPVAVLPLNSGGERYAYRGAPVSSDEYTDEGIEHAKAIGLVGKPKK
ncbi:hypothetical protein [Microbacterium sp. AG238]|uniref:hypothetical protein n=1 Tax=Microbacterium sp. AG238 TaxID=2183994 RepID=UPI000E709B44|nr:hypothetical protein [Microbacterium sp. AG238]RKE60458.1 hypothetical protein DEU36_2900 [Microbacterium sp. AG238]